MSQEWSSLLELLQRVAIALETGETWLWHIIGPAAIVLNGLIGLWAGFQVSDRTRRRDREKEKEEEIRKTKKILELLKKEINDRWINTIYPLYKSILNGSPFDIDDDGVLKINKFNASKFGTHDLFIIEAIGHEFTNHHYIRDDILYDIIDVHGKIHDFVDEKDITSNYTDTVIFPFTKTLIDAGLDLQQISERLKGQHPKMQDNWDHHSKLIDSIHNSMNQLIEKYNVHIDAH